MCHWGQWRKLECWPPVGRVTKCSLNALEQHYSRSKLLGRGVKWWLHRGTAARCFCHQVGEPVVHWCERGATREHFEVGPFKTGSGRGHKCRRLWVPTMKGFNFAHWLVGTQPHKYINVGAKVPTAPWSWLQCLLLFVSLPSVLSVPVDTNHQPCSLAPREGQ